MAEKLTPQQRQAVENRGGKLLVSAAAGSGKTKVLVDRLMGYLNDPVEPANIDDFLIITYTKAAAAELRGKIAAKLSEHIARQPENRHLQRQFQRLYLTQISTVHAFCSVILKEYAYMLNIPADFRVADENECLELRQTAMDKVLEEAYRTASENPDFCAFVDSQGFGRDDRQIPDIVLNVYDSARCHLKPRQWLEHCLACTRTEGIEDACLTTYGAYLKEKLFAWLDLQIQAMERCVSEAMASDGFEKPAANLEDTVHQLRSLRQSLTWDEIVTRKDIQFGTLRFPKQCTDMELIERIKAVRDACKKGLVKQTRYFADSSRAALQELNASAQSVQGLMGLVDAFDEAYTKMKKSRRILDFGDLEHNTLDLLLGISRSGATAVACEIGSRFREVMVDEYQDSNSVQDAIYGALTEKRQNLFMVGDVKQSIYQFRLADPGIFLEKYGTYVPAEEAEPGQGRKVMLSRNFRSGGAVLSATNDVFRFCMSERVGGLDYGDDEALYEGVPHAPLGMPEVALYCVDVQQDTYEEEAAFVAAQIANMLKQEQPVRDGEGFRPVKAEDIVILLRSPGSSGSYYQRALEKWGIRCVSGGGEDLLRTPEIAALHSLLQTIHNPLLDIPLVATLASPVFGFTADELAGIRSADKFGSVFSALQNSSTEKSVRFLQLLTKLRATARLQPLTQLLEEILLLTHLDRIYGAMEGGETRKENLQTFFQLAAGFESGGRSDLGRFLDYLQNLAQKGLTGGGEQSSSGCVSIMSIHKSKGLEFPVVFLCGLSRAFNTESQRAAVLCHKDMGLGFAAVDHERRLRYPTIAKGAIASMIGAEGLSEELRVLYVAMTRAKDRLIMTYASDALEKELREMVLRSAMGCNALLISEAVCPGEWVLLTALQRTEAGALFQLGGKPKETSLGSPPWGIYVERAPQEVSAVGQTQEQEERTGGISAEAMREALLFRYDWPAATSAPSKQTATQRKGRVKDEEAAEHAAQDVHFEQTLRKPSFVARTNQATDYGTAVHTALQFLDFAACSDADGIAGELDRLEQHRFLSSQQRQMLSPQLLERFFCTALGHQVRTAARVIREFKFSVLEDGAAYDPAWAGEQVLLQGVVDCAILEDDGIILLDFKTDRVTEETLPDRIHKYIPQVEAYASALTRIYELPVKKKYLYFFHLNRVVEL